MFIQGTDGAQMSLHDEDTQGGSNMTGTDLYVKKKAALRSSCASLRE